MSIALMTQAWRLSMPATQKMVLLAMCDWANDQGGSLFPSIAQVAERASVSERHAQRVIHGLIDAGWLAVVRNAAGGAPGASRHYRIAVDKLRAAVAVLDAIADARRATEEAAEQAGSAADGGPDGADSAPITGDMGVTGDILSGVTSEHRRVTWVSQTGDMGVTLTTNNRHKDKERLLVHAPREARAARGVVQAADDLKVEDVDPEVLRDFAAMRKRKRAHLTAGIVADLRAEGLKAGMELTEVMRTCLRRGWVGFDAAWLEREKGGSAGGGARRTAAASEPAWRTEQRRRTAQAVPGIASRECVAAAGGDVVDLAPGDVRNVPALQGVRS